MRTMTYHDLDGVSARPS